MLPGTCDIHDENNSNDSCFHVKYTHKLTLHILNPRRSSSTIRLIFNSTPLLQCLLNYSFSTTKHCWILPFRLKRGMKIGMLVNNVQITGLKSYGRKNNKVHIADRDGSYCRFWIFYIFNNDAPCFIIWKGYICFKVSVLFTIF